ncbi:hypothetical protein [Streptomyces violascens]|uniref:hypothetical protein n=1 Tax=Streptomyces violascens TaxID=67381 RepID=UPI00364F4546
MVPRSWGGVYAVAVRWDGRAGMVAEEASRRAVEMQERAWRQRELARQMREDLRRMLARVARPVAEAGGACGLDGRAPLPEPGEPADGRG